MDTYAEYKCAACKKEIKNIVVQCKTCDKIFLHPGCTTKHKVYNKNRELIQCSGPYEKFTAESEKEAEMKKTPSMQKGNRERMDSTGSAGTPDYSGVAQKSSNIDLKIDSVIKLIKEMRNEMACKREIKVLIKEAVQEEILNVRSEIEELRQEIRGKIAGSVAGAESGKSYSNAVKENIIIVTPKVQQESEITKKLVKEKVNIKNMPVGITKLRKGGKGTVILGCETGEEMEKLKTTVQAQLGEKFKVTEPQKKKPKVKIVGVGAEEINLDDDELMETIKIQNRVTGNMRLIKRIKKGEKGDGSIIIEADEKTHELMLRREKINLGWKKCLVFNYVNVKRCFNCWGYYHIAKNCTREVTCHKCTGNHKANECKAKKARCVNCMHKIQTYNLKINDEHDALDSECPTFKRALEEEKKRIGWNGWNE